MDITDHLELPITIDGQIVADYITAGTLSAELIQSGFNDITAGTSITQEGIKQVDASGEYAIMAGGGMRFYTSLDTLNGSIESSYQGTEETGVGIFIQPGRKFVLVRQNPENIDNETILELPTNVNELRLRKTLNAYGNSIRDASTIRTRNDINESVFSTWSSGEAFIGGTTGARLGYLEAGQFYSRLLIPKTGTSVLIGELEANSFKLANRETYLTINDSGGSSIVTNNQFTLAVGSKSSWSNMLRVNSEGTTLFNKLNANYYDLVDVNKYKNGNGHLFDVGSTRIAEILSGGLVMFKKYRLKQLQHY